jgi:hypothetical protein
MQDQNVGLTHLKTKMLKYENAQLQARRLSAYPPCQTTTLLKNLPDNCFQKQYFSSPPHFVFHR